MQADAAKLRVHNTLHLITVVLIDVFARFASSIALSFPVVMVLAAAAGLRPKVWM